MLVLPVVHLADAAVDGREMRLNASERRVHLADARGHEHLRGDANHRRHAEDGAAYLRDHHDRVGAHAILAAFAAASASAAAFSTSASYAAFAAVSTVA